MKFHVDVDCTPEEARSFLGLPDMKPIHDMYIQAVKDTLSGQNNVEQMEKMFKSLSPLGDAGMKFFSSFMDIGLGNQAMGTQKKDG
jgi:oligoendopeptidase F